MNDELERVKKEAVVTDLIGVLSHHNLGKALDPTKINLFILCIMLCIYIYNKGMEIIL